MKLATWNVNSIRARLERVLPWVEAERPDVLCLQELKVELDKFPVEAFTALGYTAALHCQKTYNGVAILARAPLGDVRIGLEDEVDDAQARLIGATVDGVRVLSAYFPNGQAVGSDKWSYKLAWMERLRRFLERRHRPDEPLVLCGDFNVAPEAKDVHDPVAWANEPLFHVEARQALERLRVWGLVDLFRLHHWQAGFYSWWDYQLLAFPKNRGLRIDHLFATEPVARRCLRSFIDREARKGERPSDHAPVVALFE